MQPVHYCLEVLLLTIWSSSPRCLLYIHFGAGKISVEYVCRWNLKSVIVVRMKALEQYFVCCFRQMIFVRFSSVDALRFVQMTNDDWTPTTKGGQFDSIHMFSTQFFKIKETARQMFFKKLPDNFNGAFKETEETWTDHLNALSRWRKMLHWLITKALSLIFCLQCQNQ